MLAYFAVCALVLGCVGRPEREPVPLQDVPVFSADGGVGLAERWWTAFDDAQLNERVDRALAGNYDLAAAWGRLEAASAIARRAGADRYPRLDALAGVSRRESSDANDRTEVSLGLAASYELDLWGRIDAQAEADALRAQATEADYRAAGISLSSAVALTWYQITETLLQLELVQSQLETNQTSLDLLEGRFDAGLIRFADVLRQQQLVEATAEQAIVLRARLEVLEHQLAVLEGRPPQGENALPDAALPALPPMPATGLPARLLERRPDIRAAMLRLEAADEDVAAAVSDRYPRINLSASLETFAERPQELFEDWLLSLAGNLIAPVLDGGARSAEVDRTAALRRQRLAEYGQAVLTAFGEVEDALAQERRQSERIDSLTLQLDLAQRAVDELRRQYLNGVTDYLSVLTAVRDLQRLERDVLSARLDLIAYRVALYRALAGGFETPREQGRVQDQTNQEQGVD